MSNAERLFLAWWPPAIWREVIADLGARIAREDERLRAVEPASIHLTLRFLGATPADRREALRARLDAGHSAWRGGTFRPHDVAWWPSPRRPQVCVIEAEADAALHALAAELESIAVDCGAAPEARGFRAHITLARAGGGVRGAQVPPIGSIELATQSVDHIALVRSRTAPGGAVYTELARWPLRP